jgi:hypothetical protein
MRGLALRLAVGAGVLASIAVAAPAIAAEDVEFVDVRPIVVDLRTADVGDQWRLQVLDRRPEGAADLTAVLAFQPPQALSISGPTLTGSGSRAVTEFVLTLRQRVAGSGQVLVVAGGQIIRRDIRTTRTPNPESLVLPDLRFRGTRMLPFTDLVRVSSIEVPELAGVLDGDDPVSVGRLTSTTGSLVEVLWSREGLQIAGDVEDGRYDGSVDLSPGVDGGAADVTLQVRDVLLWPLAVLLLGLGLVQVLDGYQRRLRPRRLIEFRLAKLRDRARREQARIDRPLEITSADPGQPLLLDRLVTDALSALGPLATPEEVASLDSGGTAYLRISAVVDRFVVASLAISRLRANQEDASQACLSEDRPRVRRALEHLTLFIAAPVKIESEAMLDETAERIAATTNYLAQFREIYAIIARARSEPGADTVLAELLSLPSDLSTVRGRAYQLAASADVREVPDETERPPVLVPPRSRVEPPPASARRPARLGLVAALVLAGAVSATIMMLQFGTSPSFQGPPPDGGGPTASQSPTGEPGPAELPLAPVALPTAPTPSTLAVEQVSVWDLVWWGGVAPVLLLILMGLGGWLSASRWRRRTADGLADLGATAAIARAVRTDDLQFAVLSGVLVVAGGIAVLYAGNPAFGSPGDYLGVAVWGTTLSEGLALARRLLPGPR